MTSFLIVDATLAYNVILGWSFLSIFMASLCSHGSKIKALFSCSSSDSAVIVMTNSELDRVLTKSNFSGRLAKWTIEQSEYDIRYQPRTVVKAQALVDFLAEVPNTQAVDSEVESEAAPVWQAFVDGSSRVGGRGVGILLIAPSGEETRISIRLSYKAYNNEAKYEVVLFGLQAAQAVGTT